jgi:hypothetical protein
MSSSDFPHPQWFDLERFDGYGRIDFTQRAGKDCLSLKPMRSASPSETHAALVTSARAYANFDATFTDVVTLEQLRECAAPNPWERAWLLWRFVDVQHFYYLIMKENGWELGKRDPAYHGGQRFLATADQPSFPVGCANTVRVRQHGNAITIDVDERHLVAFVDAGDPAVPASADAYRVGRFGFYCEDAHVRFGDFTVEEEPEPVAVVA